MLLVCGLEIIVSKSKLHLDTDTEVLSGGAQSSSRALMWDYVGFVWDWTFAMYR